MTFGRGPELVLHVAGPLRLLRRDGVELTPRLAKAQGMLALLATSTGLRRPRIWLQDKLWSDRPPEQGGASLRQTLVRVRRGLGAQADALLLEPGWIGLDPRRITVVLDPRPEDWAPASEPPEFCEGLDIADPEFEDWIRDQRMVFESRWLTKLAAAPAVPDKRRAQEAARTEEAVFLVGAPEVDRPELTTLATMVATEVAAEIGRLGGLDVRLEWAGQAQAVPDGSLKLQLKATRPGAVPLLQAQIVEPKWGSLLWTASRTVPPDALEEGSAADLGTFVADITAAAALELGRGGQGESGSRIRDAYRALRSVLSFDSGALTRCDSTLSVLDDLPGAAVRRAWRAHLRVVSLLERLAPDRRDVAEEATELAARALEEDPINPIINALAADVALHVEGRPLKALSLAQAAVERDRFSPFTHGSLAQALARVGRAGEAHWAALRALGLSAGQPNTAWWNMRCCVTAVRAGLRPDAIRFAQIAHEVAPDFRPPLRFLAALQFDAGDETATVAALAKLKRLEPDFSLDLFGSEGYPAATLRECGLMKVAASGLAV